jgi:D-xylose transport system substrate-binding protein
MIPASEGYRWPIDQKYVELVAANLNAEVITRAADNDENKQLKQANELLEMGVDVLIVVPVNSNTSAAIVREAHRDNVPVVGYDRLIKNSDLDYLVTFEGAKIADLMVAHAIRKVPNGNYVLLWGDAGDVNAIMIKEAQEKLLNPYIESGAINVVYKGFVENWSSDNACHIMKHILSFSEEKIDAVMTSYDGLAKGVLLAAKDFPNTSFDVLTGQDAEIGAIKSIIKGEMSLTVYKSIPDLAEASTELAVKLARGEEIENISSTINNGRKDVPVLMLEPVGVTKNNIRSTVIADGFYTEEEVYGK